MTHSKLAWATEKKKKRKRKKIKGKVDRQADRQLETGRDRQADRYEVLIVISGKRWPCSCARSDAVMCGYHSADVCMFPSWWSQPLPRFLQDTLQHSRREDSTSFLFQLGPVC